MNKVVALNPIPLPDNEFIKGFTSAVRDGGYSVIGAKWRLRDFIKPNVVILHWPNSMFIEKQKSHARRNILKILIARTLFRTKFVWVVHNLMPHSVASTSPTAKRFIDSLSGMIHLSKASVAMVEAEYGTVGNARQLITLHGAYEPVTATSQIRMLRSDDQAQVAYVGQVKPYKNLERLIHAATGMQVDRAKLTITGKSDDHIYADRIRSMAIKAGVQTDIRSDLIDIPELERLIDNSDCVVLPYSRVLNSGSALFCLSRHRPIIVPNMGALPELAANVGEGWVYLYDGEVTAETLSNALVWLTQTSREREPDLSMYSWQKVGKDINDFIEYL